MELELEQVLEQEEPAYLVFPVFQVYQTVTPYHLLACHMTALHIPHLLGVVLQQLRVKQPGPDIAEPACNQRTSDLVGTREGYRAPAFVPYKDMTAIVRIPLVEGTNRRLVPRSAAQQKEARR